MPELRSGVRRNRAPSIDLRQKPGGRAAAVRKSEHKVGNYVRTRAAVAKEAAEAAAAVVGEKERGKKRAAATKPQTQTRSAAARKRAKVALAEWRASDRKGVKVGCVEEVGVGGGVEGGQCENQREAMIGDNSGGLSANKATGQEEEGSTSPFPERVSLYPSICMYIQTRVYV